MLDDLGLSDLPVAGVAKGPDRDAGREHFYVPGRASFMLEARDPVLYYIQRLRDEAHRFAIGSHRARRSKAIGVNPLDEVPGIGPTRKKALLQAFGSAKSVARASVTDLAAVDARFGKAVYELQKPLARCRSHLEKASDVAPGDLADEESEEGFLDTFDWLEAPGEGKPANRILGRVLIGPTHWRLEGNGGERFARTAARGAEKAQAQR